MTWSAGRTFLQQPRGTQVVDRGALVREVWGGGRRERTRSGYGCNELRVKAGSMSQSCCRDGVIEQQVSDLELSRSLPDGGGGVIRRGGPPLR